MNMKGKGKRSSRLFLVGCVFELRRLVIDSKERHAILAEYNSFLPMHLTDTVTNSFWFPCHHSLFESH